MINLSTRNGRNDHLSITFLKSVLNYFENHSAENLILGGDFNSILTQKGKDEAERGEGGGLAGPAGGLSDRAVA